MCEEDQEECKIDMMGKIVQPPVKTKKGNI
jgi:hypothetical protein